MSKVESEMVSVDEGSSKVVDDKPLISSNTSASSNVDGVSPSIMNLAKKFAIEGGLLAEEDQLLIEDRTTKRARLSLLRKQSNIENILKKTLSYCAGSDIGQKTDHDWFSRYIELSEEVSNPTMQDLWAKILAKELTRPGTFSFKTLQTFRDMSIHDAKLLAKACSLAVKEPHKKGIRLISSVYQKPGIFNFFSKERQQYINLSHFGLNYADLLALAENHLIYLQESELSLLNKQDTIVFNYNGQPLKLSSKKTSVALQFYKFTAIGMELANLITDKANKDFFEHLKQKLNTFFLINNND